MKDMQAEKGMQLDRLGLYYVKVKFCSHAESMPAPPPLTGEHTEDVLRELGYGDDRMEV